MNPFTKITNAMHFKLTQEIAELFGSAQRSPKRIQRAVNTAILG